MGDREDAREIERLWEALEKQSKLNDKLSEQLTQIKTDIAVLQLKASLWTVIGAFVATALWFLKDIVAKVKGP